MDAFCVELNLIVSVLDEYKLNRLVHLSGCHVTFDFGLLALCFLIFVLSCWGFLFFQNHFNL